MMRERVVKALLDIAQRLGSIQDGSEWYLFGSVDRGEPAASDIDLLILCTSEQQADALRREIDPDDLPLPLDLGLMTFGEAGQVDAVNIQGARLIHPCPSCCTAARVLGATHGLLGDSELPAAVPR